MRIGIIRKNGKITGYKSPENKIDLQFFEEKKLKAKVTKEQIRDSDNALCEWSRWLYGSYGYGNSSSSIDDICKLPACSRPPHGVEMSKRVARVIEAFDVMKKASKSLRSHYENINTVYFYQKENEPIKKTFQRLQFSFSYKQFLTAKKSFASIFEKI